MVSMKARRPVTVVPQGVRVTVSGGKISAVEVVSHGDSSSYFSRAKAVIDKVINKQSTDVDTVSNATYSSWGILNCHQQRAEGCRG